MRLEGTGKSGLAVRLLQALAAKNDRRRGDRTCVDDGNRTLTGMSIGG